MAVTDGYETILTERSGRVASITLNRPRALNALNLQMMGEVTAAAKSFDSDPDIGVILFLGSERAFAAGADIKELMHKTRAELVEHDWFVAWSELDRVRKPLIAAVSGYVLGGGCELAMMCDVIVASETARFGQPEVRLGIIPGLGGSQRLTRAIGKAKAMDLCLTGRTMNAAEAERAGLVSRVVPPYQLMNESRDVAELIAANSAPTVALAKEAINRSFETSLAEGLLFERRAFHATFATEDHHEGLAAFVEKREPRFVHR
jgi:enoyl-CoA hydratase